MQFLRETMEMIFPSINNLLVDGKTKVADDKMKPLKNGDGKCFSPKIKMLTTANLIGSSQPRGLKSTAECVPYLNFLTHNGVSPMEFHEPVERMKGRSQIAILHQDVFLIEATLKNISQIFEKAVLWNSKTEDLSILKDEVGLISLYFCKRDVHA